MLKGTYIELLTNYTDEKGLINDLWAEIENNYTDKKRHYHNLSHLDNLLNQLFLVKDKIEHWDTITFSLFYHDIIYNASGSGNEEKSAKLAEKRMKQINVPVQIVESCKLQILATKSHVDNADEDTNYFLDADLSILGADYETYKMYSQNIRQEYSIYPNLVYNPSRKKVLQHFIDMKRIFKTEYFYNKLETIAKTNLLKELNTL